MRRLLRNFAAARAALFRVGSLLLVALLVWVAHYDRWTAESWTLPTDYAGDAPEIMAQMKAASEGAILPLQPKVVERLGAPFGAHWNAYPTPDKHMMVAVGGLSRVVGLYTAANLALLLAPLSAALAFYFVARRMRVRWEWAWAGALLFAFAYHTFHRGLGHFNLTFSWTVPLACYSVWLVAKSRRLAWRRAEAWICLGTAAALGLSNPYNLFFWGQLMGWALVAQWFDARRRANLTIGAATIALAGAVFVAANIEVWVHVQEPEGTPLLARNYGGTEIYALKPMEMITPPTYHRWGALAFLGNRYVRWSTWRGEAFLPYLGLAGIAALAWLAAQSARRIFTRRALPGHAVSVGWLVLYATVGGLTNIVALVAGFQTFRATNRVVVFISAILLMFLVVRLTRLTRAWPAWRRIAVALAIAAIGVLDQVPRPATTAEKAEIAAAVQGDRKLARALEAALPRDAMVFQLPVLGFPETAPPYRMSDYDLFRPYLNTDSLRFSYGAAKFRARSRWQRDVEHLPPETLVRELEAYGFAALYINRKGYPDRAERLLSQLDKLGYRQRIEGPQKQQVVVLLKPAAAPVKPLGRALTFGRGWQGRTDDGIRWANEQSAVMSYYNPYAKPLEAELQLVFEPVQEADITLLRDGAALGRVAVKDSRATLKLPRLTLEPGVNVFNLRSSHPAVRLGQGRYQLRAFGLHSSSIRVSGPGVASLIAATNSD